MSTLTPERILYLKKRNKEKRMVLFSRIFIVLSFLLLWELMVKINLINSFLYSSPTRIIKTLSSLIQNGLLWKSIGITFLEVLSGFMISTVLGFLFSFLFWRFPIFHKIVDPFITVFNSLPKVALGPLIIIWFGSGISSIIFMSILISVFTTILNIYTGFISVPEYYLLLFRSFHANSFQVFSKLILPYNIPTIQTTFKINISLSLIGVIMGELLVSKSGLGYLIMYGSQVFQLDLVLTSIVVLAILSYLFYLLIDFLFIFLQKKRT